MLQLRTFHLFHSGALFRFVSSYVLKITNVKLFLDISDLCQKLSIVNYLLRDKIVVAKLEPRPFIELICRRENFSFNWLFYLTWRCL